MENKRFFYKGKFFECEEDFFDYVVEYSDSQITKKSFDEVIKNFGEDKALEHLRSVFNNMSIASSRISQTHV